MENLLILQLIAHLLTDFYGQNEKTCQMKWQLGFRSIFLYIHALLTFLFSWLFSFSLDFVWYALSIAVSHFLIDGVKQLLRNWKYVFFVDQLAHLLLIYTIVYIYNQYNNTFELSWIPSTNVLFWIFGIVLCLKPTNVLIKEVLHAFEIKIAETTAKEDELNNAGRLIGNLERLLTLLFVFMDQFEAIGFLIAAKSILRFKDTATAKTEYVLVGTLLSFGIAVLIGTIIINL